MTDFSQMIPPLRPDRENVLTCANQLIKAGVFVEVGTHKGDFAADIMRYCSPAKLYCVDPYQSYEGFKDAHNLEALDDVFESAKNRVSAYGDKVEFLRMYSKPASERFADKSLDFTYIDGNHSYRYVLEDLEAWFPKVKEGGMLCGDDAIDTVVDAERNEEGDIVQVWTRNEKGEPASWGHYGVVKAVNEFTQKNGLKYYSTGTQFMIFKGRNVNFKFQ